MDLPRLLLFIATYAAVIALPGPGVTAVIARALDRGPRGIPSMIAGFATGSLIWFTFAATGLAVLASTDAPLFPAIRYAGAAYLLFLAWKFCRAAPRPAQPGAGPLPEGPLRLFLAGLAINLGNPKAVVFFLALLPTIMDVPHLTAPGFAALAASIAVLIVAILGAYALLAARARRLFASPRAQHVANRSSAVIMAGTAATIAAR